MAATVSVSEPIVGGQPAAHRGSSSVRHFVEMIAAMVVGMAVLGGAVSAVPPRHRRWLQVTMATP